MENQGISQTKSLSKISCNQLNLQTKQDGCQRSQKEFHRPQTPSIKQIYDMYNRNYDWETFKYQIPKQYNGQEVKHTPPTGKNAPKRTNYLDQLHKITRYVPGPNKYVVKYQKRPISGKLDKTARKTLSQAIIEKSLKQNVPGPGHYNQNRPQTANQNSRNITAHIFGVSVNRPVSSNKAKKGEIGLKEREHYLNEVQYFASQVPGVGQYYVQKFQKSNIPVHLYPPKKAIDANILKLKKKDAIVGKENSSSQKILIQGSFDWMASQKKNKNSGFFGKSVRFIAGSKYEKKPGPNSYKMNTNWGEQTNVLKRTCSNSSFGYKASVYYG